MTSAMSLDLKILGASCIQICLKRSFSSDNFLSFILLSDALNLVKLVKMANSV